MQVQKKKHVQEKDKASQQNLISLDYAESCDHKDDHEDLQNSHSTVTSTDTTTVEEPLPSSQVAN